MSKKICLFVLVATSALVPILANGEVVVVKAVDALSEKAKIEVVPSVDPADVHQLTLNEFVETFHPTLGNDPGKNAIVMKSWIPKGCKDKLSIANDKAAYSSDTNAITISINDDGITDCVKSKNVKKCDDKACDLVKITIPIDEKGIPTDQNSLKAHLKWNNDAARDEQSLNFSVVTATMKQRLDEKARDAHDLALLAQITSCVPRSQDDVKVNVEKLVSLRGTHGIASDQLEQAIMAAKKSADLIPVRSRIAEIRKEILADDASIPVLLAELEEIANQHPETEKDVKIALYGISGDLKKKSDRMQIANYKDAKDALEAVSIVDPADARVKKDEMKLNHDEYRAIAENSDDPSAQYTALKRIAREQRSAYRQLSSCNQRSRRMSLEGCSDALNNWQDLQEVQSELAQSLQQSQMQAQMMQRQQWMYGMSGGGLGLAGMGAGMNAGFNMSPYMAVPQYGYYPSGFGMPAGIGVGGGMMYPPGMRYGI